MSIARNPGIGKLVIPDIAGTATQKDIAWLYEEAGFPVHPWFPMRGGKVSARGKRRDGSGEEFHFNGPEVFESPELIGSWARRWQVGFACSWRTGLIAVDVDNPAEFDEWCDESGLEVPDTVRVATGREGGYHLYYDFRHLRSVVPLDEWPKQGRIPGSGADVKAAGFVGAPGSRHPSGKLYRVIGKRRMVRKGSLAFLRRLAELRNVRKPTDHPSGEPGYIGELLRLALAAKDTEQHDAVLTLVNALEREASTEAITGAVFPFLVRALPAYDRADPWDERGLREMLGSANAIVTTAEEERLLAEIAIMEPRVAGEDTEEWFWSSREDLTAIRLWAQSQSVSPWALLGEVLAEVIARVPPTFVLPDIIAGYGTLNMLLAITGDSSAGKGGAAAVAERAIKIDEMEINFMKPERIPIGSGEGLAKNYGYRRDGELARTAYTCIPTAYEVDTLSAIIGRGSETLTSQLRQLYSGEQLGFGYADASKRILIPKYGYRGVLIAGVQPERSGVIVHDTSSGFAQRWMFLDATDPYAPDELPEAPEPVQWELPRKLYELDHDAGMALSVMKVCDAAREEIRHARHIALKGRGDSVSGHRLYTQEKFAAGLALLAMRLEIKDEDWRLAEFAMGRSDELRARCLSALRKKERSAARKEGQLEGIKNVSASDMAAKEEDRKFWQLILKHIPAEGEISRGALGKKMPTRRAELAEALNGMVQAGILVLRDGEYQGQKAQYFSRRKRG